jgi:hypothetical protein
MGDALSGDENGSGEEVLRCRGGAPLMGDNKWGRCGAMRRVTQPPAVTWFSGDGGACRVV